MVQIANFRRGEFGGNAAAFLGSVNAFDMLMSAMGADAADEMLSLIRFHDNESADAATIAQKVDECVRAVGLADENRRAATADRALNVMRGWLKLMVVEINAEFPEWEFAQAFAVFNLSDEPRPNTNLEKAILGWLATSCSTSGVEQNFSKGAWGVNDRQLSGGIAHERSTHRLLLHDGPIDDLIEGAQRVWKHCFGIERASGSDNREERSDKGTKSDEIPEKGLQKKMRSFRVQGDRGAQAAIAALAGGAWTDEHDKERTFAEDKLFKRRVEESLEGLLLPDQDSDVLQWHAANRVDATVKSQQERDRRDARGGLHRGEGERPSPEDLRGKTRFARKLEHWDELLANGVVMTRRVAPWLAEVIVVGDLTSVPTFLKWVAAVVGAYVSTPTELSTSTGACLKYSRAIASSRFIHVTDCFKANHRQYYELLTTAAGFADSKWQFIDAANFLVKKAGVYKDRTEALALATTVDMETPPLQGIKHVFGGPGFLDLITKVDFNASASGMLRCSVG
ncbi:unnamed protein product [Prorocentrum cordatum]|uniref:Selenoprotein O n=1 Tax=Prorocentrum cordatum TaxID=2364126 RepID=A0ABN9UVW8_9DINO|nr:unnamed protein product [Polarella glacialis]